MEWRDENHRSAFSRDYQNHDGNQCLVFQTKTKIHIWCCSQGSQVHQDLLFLQDLLVHQNLLGHQDLQHD